MSAEKEQEKDNKKNNNKKKKRILIIINIVLLIAVIIIAGYSISKQKSESEDKEVAYTQLIKDISNGKIKKIEMTTGSTSVKVIYKSEEELALEQEGKEIENSEQTEEQKKEEEKNSKRAIVPNTQAFIELIQKKVEDGSKIELIQNSQNVFLKIFEYIYNSLPMLIMLALFIVLFQMQGLGDKGKVYDANVSEDRITFKDVAGLKEEKEEVYEIIDFLKDPKKYTKMGAKVPKGVLLCGKPGTGKTLIAKAIAGEAKVPFISMSGSEFIEMFAGLGASRVRKLFEKAQKLSPCIIFIDEIDAIGSRRESNNGADAENNQTLNQLLVEMDGFETDGSVIVIAATNRPEMLDEALLRPGRFDRTVTIGLPDIHDREEILKIHSKNKKIAKDLDFKSLAGDTAGFSGAELANIINEAAILAAKRNNKEITNKDVDDAVKKITVGLEKKDKVVSDKDKELTAYHEAGHAVVSKYLKTQDSVKEVSIIPRGVAGGYTMYKTNEDKFFISKTEMEEKLISLLGGRAGEKIALNDISTGASNDLEVAMKIARNMVTVYGMSENVGPMSMNLERDPYQLQLLGNNMEDKIGAEVKRILENAYQQAQEILKAHRDKLDIVAHMLLEKEKISEQEFKAIFEEDNH